MRTSYIEAIEYYIPESIVEKNDDKAANKLGIYERRIAAEGELASDLAIKAAELLFKNSNIDRENIDFLIYCTQSPDYILPSTSCIIQDSLNLPNSCGAFDFTLGCSGYVYGLAMAKGMIESGVANNILLLTADTYSKYIHPQDRSVKVLFGDAASATLIGCVEDDEIAIGPFVFGTDGSGANNLIIPDGGLKQPISEASFKDADGQDGNIRNSNNLYMNGPEIFNFSLKEVPASIEKLLKTGGFTLEDYDYFVFHQANKFMLEHLRKKIQINQERFVVNMHDIGNTVSSSIPIALKRESNRFKENALIMLVGFGVGYSWAACNIKWKSTI